jgi:predicted nucleic-acid-binding protein
MKISVDTDVLARAVLNDDPAQSRVARKLLKDASLIAAPLSCLCELVWVLRQGAKLPKDDGDGYPQSDECEQCGDEPAGC